MSDPSRAATEWLTFAGGDLKAAEAALASAEFEPRHVCFHAQQSVEKALKGCLVYAAVEFPRTHDLERLCDLLPPDWASLTQVGDLGDLSQWAVESRYPAMPRMPTNQEAHASVLLARRLWAEALNQSDGHGLDVAPLR